MFVAKTHTFYFREKWEKCVRPRREQIGFMLRDTLSQASRHASCSTDESMNNVVQSFLQKLESVQTVHKMKLNSRITAVAYRFKQEESCELTIHLKADELSDRALSLNKLQENVHRKISAAGVDCPSVSFMCAEDSKISMLVAARVLPCIKKIFPDANVSDTEYKTIYEYGFSSFVNRGGECFVKKELRQTALSRLQKCPQTLVSVRSVTETKTRFQRQATLRWSIGELQKERALRILAQRTLKSPSPLSACATDASSEDVARNLHWDI